MADEQLKSVQENKASSSTLNETSDSVKHDDRHPSFPDEQASLPQATTRKERLTILTLPADIHFIILKKLHIVQATCLGLTNTKLYAVLKAIYPGKISIDRYAYSYNWAEIGLLGELITGWMKPRLLWDGFVFVTPERYRELEDHDYDLSVQVQRDYIGKW